MSNNTNIVWHDTNITKIQRAKQKKQKPCILWFTGLSGSGKSTLANALEEELFKQNYHTYLLDGDNIRCGLNNDLSFDEKSRVENIRRIGEISKLFVDAGLIIITAFISPYIKDRNSVRKLVKNDEFIEIFVDTPLETCEKRDVKGLYKKARDGDIKNFTGISAPYEKPLNPEIYLKNDNLKNDKIKVEENIAIIIKYLQKNGYLC